MCVEIKAVFSIRPKLAFFSIRSLRESFGFPSRSLENQVAQCECATAKLHHCMSHMRYSSTWQLQYTCISSTSQAKIQILPGSLWLIYQCNGALAGTLSTLLCTLMIFHFATGKYCFCMLKQTLNFLPQVCLLLYLLLRWCRHICWDMSEPLAITLFLWCTFWLDSQKSCAQFAPNCVRRGICSRNFHLKWSSKFW